MPRKLQLYILRDLLTGFAFTLGGVFVLTVPAAAAIAVQKLPGVEVRALAMSISLVLSGLMPYVLPLAYLLTVVVTYGRLAADNEWTAIRMSGTNPLQMLLPGAAFGLVLSVFTLWMAGDVLPEIRTHEKHLYFEALSEAFKKFSPGRTEIPLGEFYLSAASRNGDWFEDAYVYVPADKEHEARTILAERVRFATDDDSVYAIFKNARIVMRRSGPGATGAENGAESGEGTVVDFQNAEPTVRMEISGLQPEKEGSYTRVRYLKSREMRAALAQGVPDKSREKEYRFEIQGRRALASTYLVFLLLGASTALLMRRGTQLGAIAVSVGYALLYYLLSMRLAKVLAGDNVLPPELAAWSVIALGLVGGYFLTRKALSV